MEKMDTIIAVFPDHNAAEGVVKRLAQAGFDLKSLSVVGKGYHTDEKVVGFYNVGDRVKFWGRQGAFGAAFGACSSADCSSPFPSLDMWACLAIWPR
jgi:hypothetical protein